MRGPKILNTPLTRGYMVEKYTQKFKKHLVNGVTSLFIGYIAVGHYSAASVLTTTKHL